MLSWQCDRTRMLLSWRLIIYGTLTSDFTIILFHLNLCPGLRVQWSESRVTSLNTLEVSLVRGAVQLSFDKSCCSGSSVLIKVDIPEHWRRSYQKPCFLEATRTCLPAQPSQGIKMMEYRQESTNREFLTIIHWYIWLRRHLFPDHIFTITEPIQK